MVRGRTIPYLGVYALIFAFWIVVPYFHLHFVIYYREIASISELAKLAISEQSISMFSPRASRGPYG